MDSSNPRRRALWVGLAVVGIVALALFLRAYWNLDAAHPAEDVFVLSGGSDPYYHHYAMQCILSGDCGPDQDGPWSHFLKDPLLNYPFGSINPNPPLFQWSTAIAAGAMSPIFFGGDTDTALWWATIWAPAIWGALTVIPVYLIGAAIWNRRTGLIAGLFWALSTTAIGQTALGDADHDAMVLFFIVLGMYFFVRTIHAFRGNTTWVERYNDGASIRAGVTRLFQARSQAFAFAALSGMSIAAVALIWKGFPYVIGIMAIYGVFQLLVDHWKNRDSLGVFLAITIAFLVGLLVSYPYYGGTGLTNFFNPILYVFLGWLVVGAVLVPTRDLPTVLVMPLFAIAGIVGLLGVYLFARAAWVTLLYALVYFRQTALYQTIAEAQPADFNQMVFGVGPVIFLLAIVGLGWLAWGARKGDRRDQVFALVWALVALYMATSAVRFLFNAVPILVLIGAAFTSRVIDWTNFGSIRKNWGHNGLWAGVRRSVRVSHVLMALLFALVLVLPQVVLAFDAAVPPSTEQEWQRERIENWLLSHGYTREEIEGKPVEGQDGLRELYVQKRLELEGLDDTAENRAEINRDFTFFVERRLGAFGQSFLPGYWSESLDFLDEYSAENYPGPYHERPGFLSWWDYGHWAISVGNHPAVADNFQNGYQFAANFLLAQNETHATQLLAARMMPLLPQDARVQVVQDSLNVSEATARTHVEDLLDWEYVHMSQADAVRLVDATEQATCATDNGCKMIRYFVVDSRMMPLDDPSTTTFIDRSSIFTAPVILAGEDPDEYVPVRYTTSNLGDMAPEEVERRLSDPTQLQPQITGQKLAYTPKFTNSMYYRGFVGTPAQQQQGGGTISAQAVLQAYFSAQPGFGMQHFRAIYVDQDVRILQYTPGVTLSSSVQDDTGAAIAGASVQVLDEFGIVHGAAVTDANGTFSLTAPFSMEEGLTLRAVRDGVQVANATVHIPISETGPGATKTVDPLVVRQGTVNGRVYYDADGNGRFNATNDTVLDGFQFSVAGTAVTTNATGNYTATVTSGNHPPTTDNATYEFRAGTRVRVDPDATRTQDLAVVLRSVNLTGTVSMEGRPDTNFTSPLPQLVFTADPSVADNTAVNATKVVNADGTYSLALKPGQYLVSLAANYTHQNATGGAEEYTLQQFTLPVPVAGDEMTQNIVLNRVEDS